MNFVGILWRLVLYKSMKSNMRHLVNSTVIMIQNGNFY